MNGLSTVIDRVRGMTLDRLPAMRPSYPPVAMEIDPDRIVMVRLKRRRGGKPVLESHQLRPMPEQDRATSIFRPLLTNTEEVLKSVRELFEATATKPGRMSLILPDNLAKVSLLHLPELPGSRRQLDEIVRFKLRRAVPFRLDDAVMSYQVLSRPEEDRGATLLVVLMRRVVVEQYEGILTAVGARPGLIDLCTPNLLNLARKRIGELQHDGGDVALLNYAAGYFSLLIVRNGKLIFYRCKSLGAQDAEMTNGMMVREIGNSLAYYQEKLEGQGLRNTLVRIVSHPEDEVIERLRGFGFGEVEMLDPSDSLAMPDGVRFEPDVAQRLAPAVAAAVGR